LTPTPQQPKKLKAKKQGAHAVAASEAEFDRLRRRAPQLCGADGIWSKAQFYGCGTWDVSGTSRGWPRRTTSSTNWRRTRRRSVSSRDLA
jgi:hypothetical protein